MVKQLKSLTFVNDNISNTYQVSEPLPVATEADKGKVLTIDENGAHIWEQPANVSTVAIRTWTDTDLEG